MSLIRLRGPELFDGRELVKVSCLLCHDVYWTEPDREVCVWQERGEQGKWTLAAHREIAS